MSLFNRLLTGILILMLTVTAKASIRNSAPPDSLTVRQINISGNKVTKREVILREILFRPGQKLDTASLRPMITRSRNQLLNTSLFLSVIISDSISGDQLIMDITVRERWYVVPRAYFSLADRNFNEWWAHKDLYRTTFGAEVSHYNFLGRRQRLTIGFSLGWRQSLHLNYRIPYLNRPKTLGMTIDLNSEQGHELGYNTIANRLMYLRDYNKVIYRHEGIGLNLTYRKHYIISQAVQFNADHFVLGDTISRIKNPEYIGNGHSSELVFQLGYRFTRDRQDRNFYAHTGSYLSTSVRQTYFAANNITYPTLQLDYEKFIPLSERTTYMGGIVSEYNFRKDIPYLYRSSLGYRYNVRGYEHYVFDGQSYFLIGNELRYRIFKKDFRLNWLSMEQFNHIPIEVQLKIFSDQGIVNYFKAADNNNLLNHWQSGYGAGLDFLTYYDQIMRIEYSVNNLFQSEVFFHFIEVF